jgi:hypothetical protein
LNQPVLPTSQNLAVSVYPCGPQHLFFNSNTFIQIHNHIPNPLLFFSIFLETDKKNNLKKKNRNHARTQTTGPSKQNQPPGGQHFKLIQHFLWRDPSKTYL